MEIAKENTKMAKKYLVERSAEIEKALKESGFYELDGQGGLLLETGESLKAQQEGWEEEDPGKGINFFNGEIYLTNSGEKPEYLGYSVDEALEELADRQILPASLCAYCVEVIRDGKHSFEASWTDYYQTEAEARKAFARKVQAEKLELSAGIGYQDSVEGIYLYQGPFSHTESILEVEYVKNLTEETVKKFFKEA
jgi:hypothetical protein